MEKEIKSYAAILADVKQKTPGLSHIDAQIAASEIFKQAKSDYEASKEFTKPPVIPAAQNKAVNLSDNTQLADAIDAAIRAKGIDKNNIMSIARTYNPDFVLVKGEKHGVNTKCWLEGPCRVPANGHYLLFL